MSSTYEGFLYKTLKIKGRNLKNHYHLGKTSSKPICFNMFWRKTSGVVWCANKTSISVGPTSGFISDVNFIGCRPPPSMKRLSPAWVARPKPWQRGWVDASSFLDLRTGGDLFWLHFYHRSVVGHQFWGTCFNTNARRVVFESFMFAWKTIA